MEAHPESVVVLVVGLCVVLSLFTALITSVLANESGRKAVQDEAVEQGLGRYLTRADGKATSLFVWNHPLATPDERILYSIHVLREHLEDKSLVEVNEQ